ncbi:MAG: glycine zipper domain-containing protein [Persicimonas sp.]
MSLNEIQHTVEESLDWRGWVSEHPWETVGLGVAVGFYLGLR